MHTQELVVTHAFGIRNRTKKMVVCDSFEPGSDCREKVKKLMSFIMNKKAKSRFGEYQRLSKDVLGKTANVLELPNETRVAGTYRMFVSCLRAKSGINLYCSKSSEVSKIVSGDMGISRDEWRQISEFEAILKVCHDLAMESQVEQPGSNCYSYYAVAECRDKLKSASSLFEIISQDVEYGTDLVRENLPKAYYGRKDMTKDSQQLLERLDNEFGRYFNKPDGDQLLAMFFHPFIVCCGYK
jgi:hypothetical protein